MSSRGRAKKFPTGPALLTPFTSPAVRQNRPARLPNALPLPLRERDLAEGEEGEGPYIARSNSPSSSTSVDRATTVSAPASRASRSNAASV